MQSTDGKPIGRYFLFFAFHNQDCRLIGLDETVAILATVEAIAPKGPPRFFSAKNLKYLKQRSGRGSLPAAIKEKPLKTLLIFLALAPSSFPALSSAQTTGSQTELKNDLKTASPTAASARTAVPALVPYSGIARSVDGKALTGETGITFLIFKDEQGGEPSFIETQTIALDATGIYRVQLGATLANGIPLDLFATGEARWIEVQIAGQPAQPRALMLSVPYALKAADAATLGGLPASAFALANTARPASITPDSSPASTVTTPGGTSGYLSEFTAASTIADSPLYAFGASIGIGTTTPAATLDVDGTALVEQGLTVVGSSIFNGPFVISPTGTASPTKLYPSNYLKFLTSVYNSSTKSVIQPRFQMQAEVQGNNTAAPTGTLNLLASNGTGAPVETGLHFNTDGTITFATNQTFPGTGPGTITGVTAGTALTGGGTSGNLTLNLDTTKVPLLAASNTFTGNQTINGNLTASGTASAGTFNANNGYYLNGTLFAAYSSPTGSVYLGPLAGNATSSGNFNTATGVRALTRNTTGADNTATGAYALIFNTSGSSDTATGFEALDSNISGSNNTATGYQALLSNGTGDGNTATGYQALFSNTTGGANTANGISALYSNTSGIGNTADGTETLSNNTTGYDNTANGMEALSFNTTGYENTASGFAALSQNSTGYDNTANGERALSNSTGNYNTASGAGALGSTGTGNYNTAIGFNSGYARGAITSGSNNTLVGANAYFSTGTINNATAIGAYAEVAQDNTLVLGCTPIGGAAGNQCPGAVSVGIGTSSPDSLLTVNGTADKPGGGSWGTYSDMRLKTVNGGFSGGLDQVMQIHPIRYRYKPDNGMGIRDADEHIGVVAQEVQRVIPEAVTENNKGYLLVNNDPILWSMVNAIKEQQREIQEQKREIQEQRKLLQAQTAVNDAQQKLLRAQTAAMQSLSAEVRETRKTLRQVKAQTTTGQMTMIASK